MKKTLLVIAITMVSLVSTFARDISEKRNLVGFTAGFSLNTMGLQKDSTFENTKNTVKPGGVFGINFEHRFKKVFALELAINYTNKGTQKKIEDPALNRSFFRYNFHSVELPVIAKFYIGKKKIFNLNVGGYASYAFNVQSRLKIDFKNNSILDDIDERENNLLKDFNDKDVNGNRPFRPFDAGVNVGFEFISRKGFGAGARVQQGLVDYTNPKFFFDDNKKVYHTSVLFYAIMKF